MKFAPHSLCLLALTLYVLLHTAQVGVSQHVPGRCTCPNSVPRVRGSIKHFRVAPKRAGCHRDEIILVMQKGNQAVCLSPVKRQGRRLLQCWRRMQDSRACLQKLRAQRRGQWKQTNKKGL